MRDSELVEIDSTWFCRLQVIQENVETWECPETEFVVVRITREAKCKGERLNARERDKMCVMVQDSYFVVEDPSGIPALLCNCRLGRAVEEACQ